MRLRTVIHIIGILLAGLGVTMLIAAVVALLYQEEDSFAFIVAAACSIGAGLLMFFASGKSNQKMGISHRGAFAVVTFGWIASCIFGALPYFFYAQLPHLWFADAPEIAAGTDVDTVLSDLPDCSINAGLGKEFCLFTNCVFESTSGFTTTGATILEAGLWHDPASRKGGLPHGLLFWRALTHFLGGMGIILLGVAILPLLGVGGMQLFKAEVPGPVKDKMAPRVAETARLLWKVYAGLTFVEFLLLLTTGQGPFLAICHSFATMATGGFSPLAFSIETLQSSATEWIIIVFMFLAGANFALHFNSFRRNKILYWKDQEFRFYALITLFVTLILTVSLWVNKEGDASNAIRIALFQVVSVLTTTGFSTRDFALWAIGSQLLLFVLFFIGGCSGSTGGGIKCVRVFLMIKLAVRELKRLVHPHGVIQTKLSGSVVPSDVVNSVAGFVILYLVIFFVSVLVLGFYGYDFLTSFTAVGANIGNIGPGFGQVGPSANYNFFVTPLKWHLVFLMIVGRLEIYSVLIVLTPEFWRK